MPVLKILWLEPKQGFSDAYCWTISNIMRKKLKTLCLLQGESVAPQFDGVYFLQYFGLNYARRVFLQRDTRFFNCSCIQSRPVAVEGLAKISLTRHPFFHRTSCNEVGCMGWEIEYHGREQVQALRI